MHVLIVFVFSSSSQHMLTLFELQERYDKALECGQRALRITEKVRGSLIFISPSKHYMLRVGT